MKQSPSISSLTPTNTTERVVDIDILRGFALFGILVVNIFYFGVPNDYYNSYFLGTFSDVLNDAVFHGVNFLFSGKFYPIFSFLFGLGFFIQFTKLRQKGAGARSFFIRRLTILLLIGVVHVFLVWEEEILLFYALFGFVLIFLADRSPKVIIISAAVAYAIFVCFDILFAVHFIPSKYSPFDSLGSYITFYTTASYWQILHIRLVLYANKILTLDFFHHFDRLAFFLVGLYAGKKDLIADISARKNHWTRLWIVAFIFGILLQTLWIEDLEKSLSVSLIPIMRIVTDLFLLGQVFTYIVGVLLLINIKIFRKWFQVFSSPGRMALTNYMVGTTTFSLLFYSYGLGLYASLSPVQLILISLLFFIAQVIFSNIWLRYLSYGPMEWVWRSLTYKKVLPLIKPRVLPLKSVSTE